MENTRHYTGLTEAEVLESRKKHGENTLTPPQEESLWGKLKNCLRFWLLRVFLTLLAAATLAVAGLQATGTALPEGVWAGPVLLAALTLLTWAVAFMGGKPDENTGRLSVDPLVTILLAALAFSGAIAFYQSVTGGEAGLEPYLEPLGIAAAVLLATGVAYLLERRNEKTFRSLNEVDDDTPVKVTRGGRVCQTPRRDIVVGDIVILETGEEVPADCELLEALNLTVNESTLTGEPQCAKTADPARLDKEAVYPSNHIMKGCTITEGYCVARVFAVGDATACGKVLTAARVREGESTPLSEKLEQLAGLITKASYAIAALILVGRMVVYFARGGCLSGQTADIVGLVKYALDTVMVAVTLIVVAVPEGLPMAITLSLAFSMRRLMRQNTLPRTMHACETMGAVSVICTDKTGTLTKNRMTVYETCFPGLPGQRLGDDGLSRRLLECVAANTTANLDLGDPARPKAVGNPTEGALLLWLRQSGADYLAARENATILDRLPFNTELKYMATLVQSGITGRRTLYVKGAPEIVMSFCALAPEEKARYDAKLAEYQGKAMRTLAFAYAEPGDGLSPFADGQLQTSGLTMLGVAALSDPVRDDAPAAIRACLDAGIRVKIITGDTPGTAKEIGRQTGLWTDTDTEAALLSGRDIEAMTDTQLEERLPAVKIIARARPHDKERIVRALRRRGEVVAVTGDGTNDAPALNAANAGLSMGDGTAVAKEASDMTILDNSFSTIANAVMWGRSLYKNIKRFILFQMTVNVVACLIVLTGAFTGTESPLTVTQMLWVNLIMDTFAALALASLPPSRDVMSEKPRPATEPILKGMGAGILGTGLTFTAALLALLLLFQHTDVTSLAGIRSVWGAYDGLSPYESGLFFTAFVMLQFWNLFNAKAFMTGHSAFKGLSWSGAKGFLCILLLIMAGQLLITETPGLQRMFNIAQGGVSAQDWLIIAAATSLTLWTGEVIRLARKRICR